MGFSQEGEVLFQYVNEEQQVQQSFSVAIKKYLGHMKRQPNINRRDVAEVNKTLAEKKDQLTGEGPYLFIPEWRDPLPHMYGVLDTNVVFEQG